MPLYDYVCHTCGAFREWASMAQAGDRKPCRRCGELSERTIAGTHLRVGRAAVRYRAEAHNEKSAHEPTVERRLKKHTHGAPAGAKGSRPRRSKRPWMVGH